MTDLDEDFKEKGGRPKKKSFTDVARAAGIKDAILDILLNEDFDSIEAVKCLSEDIVRSMDLTRVSSCSGCSLCSRKRGCRRRHHTHYLLPPRTNEGQGGIGNGFNAGRSWRRRYPASTVPPAPGHPSAGNMIARNGGTLDGLNGTYTPHLPLRLAEIIKYPRPFEFVDRDFKKAEDVKTFADLMYGATIILENAIIGKNSKNSHRLQLDLTPCILNE